MLLRKALLAIIPFIALHAHAADIGECATPEGMTAKLKAEDQHSVASAQMITQDKRLFGMIFTMSGDRKTGYILKADQPLGDRAGQICVYNRMADVRLFDARKPGPPADALLKASDADALKRCDELAAQGKMPRASCGAYNVMVGKGEAYGNRLVLQALGVDKGTDGRYKPAASLTTVSGNISGSVYDNPKDPARGIIGDIKYLSLPDGATIINTTLVYVRYTEYGLAALK
ncbi:MAG: hypothetical protein QM740_17810 [Acidovorax sp.]